MVKSTSCNAGDPGLIPGLGKSPGEGNGYLLQYSFFINFFIFHNGIYLMVFIISYCNLKKLIFKNWRLIIIL